LNKNFHTPAFNTKKLTEESENLKKMNKEFTLDNEKKTKDDYATCNLLFKVNYS
jgi:hypothetical protein